MAGIPISDEACDRLVRTCDPIDVARLHDEAVVRTSRRLRDELLRDLGGEPSFRAPTVGRWRRRGSRGSGRRVAAAGTLMAVVAVGVLAMVGWLPIGGGQDGPLDVPAASAAAVLDQAAQAAMRSAIVAPGRHQYGFLKVETAFVAGTASAVAAKAPNWNVWARTIEVKSDWYRADGSGRERVVRKATSFLTPRDRAIAKSHGMTLARVAAAYPRVLDGALRSGSLLTAGILPYWQMNRLPTQPAALRSALERLLVATAPNRARGPMMRQLRAHPGDLFSPISQFLFLPTSRGLRAALFRVLAGLPGVQLLGRQRDRLGRSGIAVAVTLPGGPDRVREELLFDPATSNLLQTQMVELPTRARSASGGPSMPAGTVVDYTDFISRGVVNSITQLPGGQRLPLKPVGGSR